MKKLRKMLAAVLATMMLLSLTVIGSSAKALDTSSIDYSVLDPLWEAMDDGSNPMYTNPPTGKSLKLSNFALLAQYAGQGYNKGTKGPIIVTQGTLKKNGKSTKVYLVTLTGLELPLLTPQTTELAVVAQAGMELTNDYEKNVRKVMKEAIPKGSNVILAGHSLGGMVAQQVAANSSIQKRYNITNIVAYGSPIIANGQVEGTLKRLGDVNDPVPYMSAETFKDFEAQDGTLQKEDSGLGFTITFDAHRNSYYSEATWGKYDVLGYKNGNATLTLNLKTQKFYASQFISLENLF